MTGTFHNSHPHIPTSPQPHIPTAHSLHSTPHPRETTSRLERPVAPTTSVSAPLPLPSRCSLRLLQRRWTLDAVPRLSTAAIAARRESSRIAAHSDGITSVGRSTAAAQSNPMIEITGRGWGHGRGLGQYGALRLCPSRAGHRAQILDHYYGGTTAAQVPAQRTCRPQSPFGSSCAT